MTDAIKQNTLDTLAGMNTAVKNMRLYPSNSAIVVNTVEKLHQTFLNVFALDPSLTLAESDKILLVDGEPLPQKDQEKPFVMSILEILLMLGIRSISFYKGLEKRELATFMEYLAKDPEMVIGEGGLQQIMERKNLPHILLDEKVFVLKDKNKQILSGLDITDAEIIEFLGLSQTELLQDQQKMLELASHPEWLLKSFDAGIRQLTSRKKTLSSSQRAEKLSNMIEVMDRISNQADKTEQTKILRGIERSASMIEPDLAGEIISQNQEHLFGGLLIKHLVGELKRMIPADEAPDEVRIIDLAGEKEAKNGNPLLPLQKKMKSLLNDSETGGLDESIKASLVETMGKLASEKGQEAIETLINRLLENLFADHANLRDQAARTLVEIIESLPDPQKNECVNKMSGRLLKWIKLETLATPAYKKICGFLKDLVNDLIRQQNFFETIPILDFFNDIRTGLLEKNDTIHEMSVAFIDAWASEEHLEMLFNHFKAGEQNKKIEAGEMLIRLGDDALKRLLDLLREQTDSNERVRIMRLVISAGRRALPLVRDRIHKDQSWYVLRNIAYILGHIGDESSAKALQPLLLHENSKVRLEALKSINRTGKNERCTLLLAALPQADHKFMLNIIDVLGNAKCTEAAATLIGFFETSPISNKSLRADMEEKICIALGLIGSPDAIPLLVKIVESKSFLGISRYPEKVKVAAGKALASLKKRS